VVPVSNRQNDATTCRLETGTTRRHMANDPELLAHQQWLGFLQPVGLVVSPPALLQA